MLDILLATLYILIMQTELKQILVRVDKETKRTLRRIAADNDSSVQIVVKDIIESALKNNA